MELGCQAKVRVSVGYPPSYTCPFSPVRVGLGLCPTSQDSLYSAAPVRGRVRVRVTVRLGVRDGVKVSV